jgi:serine/threonine protein phosphatase 1
MISKIYALGDIHNNYRALKQVLKKAKFDYENDTLISLGDIVDGGVEGTYECVEELLKIKNLIPIKGNHDEWFLRWLNSGTHPDNWIQGGYTTARSYLKIIGKEDLKYFGYLTALLPSDIPLTHWKFFASQRLYYVDDKDRCFVHGGFETTVYSRAG